MAKKTATKSVELHVYYKQGDDFNGILQDSKEKPAVALRKWAEGLEGSAKALRAIAGVIETHDDVTADADTHLVALTGLSQELAAKVIKAGDGIAVRSKIHDEEE